MMWVGLVGLWVTSLQTVPAGYAVYSAGVTRFFHTNLTDRRIRDRVYHLHCSRNLILTSEHIWRLPLTTIIYTPNFYDRIRACVHAGTRSSFLKKTIVTYCGK
jgi:hypothetical protein